MTDDERRPAEQQEFQYWHDSTDLPACWETDWARLARFEEHLRGIVALAIEDLRRELGQEPRMNRRLR